VQFLLLRKVCQQSTHFKIVHLAQQGRAPAFEAAGKPQTPAAAATAPTAPAHTQSLVDAEGSYRKKWSSTQQPT
jgi:hypothetical protein